MEKQVITISVIIPTYNNEGDLPVLLSSIQKQAYPKKILKLFAVMEVQRIKRFA